MRRNGADKAPDFSAFSVYLRLQTGNSPLSALSNNLPQSIRILIGMIDRKLSVPEAGQACQLAGRECLADHIRGTQYLPGFLFSDVDMYISSCLAECILQRVGRIGFQKGNHVLLFY